ncbi:MAG: tetraacyldisaccharide 4'-kinase [Flavobacteriaceae bacterium]|nr:tetraacyldisaccharide 4'-kinase [Flavobacteriaceae bacterium]
MAVWRKALFPFQILFASAVSFRKFLYKKGFFPTYQAPIPVVVVGNISTGGTGKTPMVDYLLAHFSNKLRLGVLSRGYGRKTKGYKHVLTTSTSSEVGDEPLMLAQKHPNVVISVCENRPIGIQHMVQETPELEAFFLDDALQHFRLIPSFKIALTTFDKPWFSDRLLPVGNLREPATAAKKVDVIVVTKCPTNLDEITKNEYKSKLGILPHQQLYFSTLVYDNVVNGPKNIMLDQFLETPFVLLTGIADPSSMLHFLNKKGARFFHKKFADHHNFTKGEIEKIRKLKRPILTTEKDAVRLKPYNLDQLYTLGIKVEFLDGETEFIAAVSNAITA